MRENEESSGMIGQLRLKLTLQYLINCSGRIFVGDFPCKRTSRSTSVLKSEVRSWGEVRVDEDARPVCSVGRIRCPSSPSRMGCAELMQMINDHRGERAWERPRSTSASTPSSRRDPILGRWVLHPFLFAAFPILSLFAQNAREVHVADLARLLGFVLLGTLLLAVVLAFVMRDVRKPV